MEQFLYASEVVVNGLMAGVMYALVALGFVLIYKASGVFNYAQGVLALFAALGAPSYGRENLAAGKPVQMSSVRLGDPAGAAAHVCQSLKPDGSFMVIEPLAGDTLGDHAKHVGCAGHCAGHCAARGHRRRFAGVRPAGKRTVWRCRAAGWTGAVLAARRPRFRADPCFPQPS